MKYFNHLTKKDSENICQASCDLESGNYLIYQRTDERLQYINELIVAKYNASCGIADERQQEIVEWYTACSDFNYAKDNEYLDENDHFLDIKWKDE